MGADFAARPRGAHTLRSYADVIALAIIALLLGVIEVEGCCFL